LEEFVEHIVIRTVEFIEDPSKAGLEQHVSKDFLIPFATCVVAIVQAFTRNSSHSLPVIHLLILEDNN